MGNHPSAHQPLERGTNQRNGLRLSKRERSTGKRMDRLRRSFRDSFRRRKDPHVPESSKPHQWQADESAVRSATCAFYVKYLGCVEVFESRGMQVCEEALKVLRNSKRKPVRAILYVSGDGLRVVEDETKGLIVDQTIEKVSFCAPDRNHDRGFSYICRDGTTRRWMCHGFLALKEPGDRLSHAVGCAFSTCLERKQRRDQECGVTMTFDNTTSTFTRSGSFRQPSLTERLQDSRERAVDVPPVRQVHNPFAIERPHATPSMLERQGSFRGFNQLNQASPFKRQLSLRVNDLPSNLERTRSLSLEPSDLSRLPLSHILPLKSAVSTIPEITPSGQDSVSAMCQQLSQGLSLLSSNDYFGPVVTETTTSTVVKELHSTTTTTTTTLPVTNSTSLDDMKLSQNGPSIINNNNISDQEEQKNNTNSNSVLNWRDAASPGLPANPILTPILNKRINVSPILSKISNAVIGSPVPATSSAVFNTSITGSPAFSTASTSSLTSSNATNSVLNRSPIPISQITPITCSPNASVSSISPVLSNVSTEIQNITTNTIKTVQTTVAPMQRVPASANLPKPEQWLGTVTSSVPVSQQQAGDTPPAIPPVPQNVRRAPPLHARALSLGSASMSVPTRGGTNDPFDAEWADIAARNLRQAAAASTTNPFIMPNATQAFQVQL